VVGASTGMHYTVVWTEEGEVYTFGSEDAGLGHGMSTGDELVPRVVEALSGKKVVGASAGGGHTVVWTEGGELHTFGVGYRGQLGHGGWTTEESEDEQANQLTPRVVEALAGKRVIGAATGPLHTVVWTEGSEVYTFGGGHGGLLGHGAPVGLENEFVPRMVEALAGKKVVEAATSLRHTVVLTETGEVYTFGNGKYGQLGHGLHEHEALPRLVEGLEHVHMYSAVRRI
jgi:alpha-tubulin suppressor-like RCC1 family protein